MRALLITGFTVCVLFVAKTNARTCESIDVRNKVTEFEKLRNCSVIVGYLQIVLFENTTRDDFENISFPELREITGFLFFYRVSGLRSIGKLFPNLSVIRGIELFNDYALIIYDMFHLQEIGLHNLSAILRGSVRIEKNTKLCYVETVNWRDLLGDAYRTFMAMNQDPSQCPPCTSSCSNNFCWNGEHCHTLTPLHCNKECIKGCEGPSNDQCHVCRNLRDETRCVSKCPSDKFLLAHLALCITKEECREQNGTWWTFQGECINSCPAGYKNYSTKGDEWNCSYCGALCPKVCDAIEVESIAAAQRLKGCTHINGDLIIRIEGLNNIENELESNLGKIEQVDGYLKVYRSFSLRSLKFLKNLRVIHGKNLENSRYSVIVNNNQNLQNLWDWKNFKLEIKNGTFSFHYNSKLCLSEIKKLHEMSDLKVNYSSVDVSLHSNGDKFACNLVSIETKVVLTDPNEVNLFFKAPSVPDQASLIGYLIYYTEAQEKNISSYDGDACGDQGWRTIFVSHDNNTEILNHTITQLEPFTQYAFYISTAYSTGKGSQSLPAYFKTLSSDPSIPLNINAVPAGSDSILITWEQPKKLNGILSQYVVLAYLQEDDRSFLDLRNYCRYPMQEMEKKTVIEEVITTTVAPATNTSCCKKENVITEIKKIDDDFDAICTDLNSYGNTASDNEYGCASFTYHVVSNQPYRKYGRSSSDNMIIKKRQQTTLKPVFNNNSADVFKNGVYHMVNGNETKYTLSGLKHYSIYILLLRACNENRTEKAQCSSVVMLSQRSGRKSNADDIINPTVESVGSNYATIKWKEPENPNSVIITYHIEYRSVEKEYFKYMAECITRLDHENASYKYTIKPLHPGNYSVRIRAQSLAGYGNYTKNIYFFISYPTKISTEIHIAISVVVILFIILAFSLYLWYRHRHQLDSVHLITRCNPDYVGYVEDEWEMDRDNIDISQELGQGTFGTVHNGMIKDKQIPCAVKTVHAKADLHDKMEFLNEASVMKSFNEAHHVVRLLGVVSRGEQPLVIMELMARGDLKTFLRSTRDSSTSLTCSEMYRMAAEIADGMAYLAAKKFVHRDLAARNCMVSCDHTVKIGDFGMTRDIYETDYYRKETRGLLPVRWMAPESLADGVFSVESDIWSYGIVLWEIATLAEQPYQGLANEQVLQFVIARGTLERPLQCPDLLYDIMEACWNWRLSNRPTFADIVEKLETHVGQDFKLVSFYHSREGEEFRMIKRQVNLSRVGIGNTMPAFGNLNISARWTKDGDESSCYISNSPRSVAPSTSYHSSNGFMSYPLSSS